MISQDLAQSNSGLNQLNDNQTIAQPISGDNDFDFDAFIDNITDQRCKECEANFRNGQEMLKEVAHSFKKEKIENGKSAPEESKQADKPTCIGKISSLFCTIF